MKRKVIALSAALVLVAPGLYAADECDCEKKEEKKESPWKTTAGLGYVNTSGNTNTDSLTFRFDTAYEVEK